MPPRTAKRIALLGLMLESNRFAPTTVKEDYLDHVYLVGDEILTELAKPEPKLPTEVPGFRHAMDAAGAWRPMPIRICSPSARAPPEHGFERSHFPATRVRPSPPPSRPPAPNVSILGGFAYCATPKNGIAIIVPSRGDAAAAQAAADDIAARAWTDHKRYVPALTSLDNAVATVREVCQDPARAPVAVADVA